MRPTTIYAAILGERGNTDDPCPRPLTCDVCCARPLKNVDTIYSLTVSVKAFMWYVTESDPLPDGWQVIEDQTYRHRMTYCPSCYADRAEGREEYDY